MLTGTQLTGDLSSMPGALGLDSVPPDVTPRISQLQIRLQVRLPGSAVSKAYPESVYQWLVKVLDGLIDFGQRHGHYGVIKLTKAEYQWLDDVLEELICSVGENENHPLAPLMDFIIRIIANYEQTYVPKLTERFSELAEEATTEISERENNQTDANTSKPSDNELAAHAFFCIGHLLEHTNWDKKKISAYEKAIGLKPDFWEAFYNLGIARYDFRQYTKAMVNFNKAIELNHNFASAYYNRGILKSDLKDYEGAIADFNETITLKPDHIEAVNHRGIAKSKLDQHESAIADFDRVIRLNPNHADAYYNKGLENNQLRNYQAAIVDFDKVIELGPNDIAA
ncbi:tetratricopeptide repeat protein, partial [Candidatus Poribacteria bacterium]|nr:tetratricopeptide repeat protein [Candidatus Poribacteria bacterium]